MPARDLFRRWMRGRPDASQAPAEMSATELARRMADQPSLIARARAGVSHWRTRRAAPSGGPTFGAVLRAVAVGTSEDASRTAVAWARSLREREQAEEDERQRREASERLRQAVERSPGRCWFPDDGL